jgi:hypothetical protein
MQGKQAPGGRSFWGDAISGCGRIRQRRELQHFEPVEVAGRQVRLFADWAEKLASGSSRFREGVEANRA